MRKPPPRAERGRCKMLSVRGSGAPEHLFGVREAFFYSFQWRDRIALLLDEVPLGSSNILAKLEEQVPVGHALAHQRLLVVRVEVLYVNGEVAPGILLDVEGRVLAGADAVADIDLAEHLLTRVL